MDTLAELQNWYFSQCDGDWEHMFGIKIDTLDNPGWTVTIDLDETELADKDFEEVEKLSDETDWIQCQVKDRKFIGAGGPHNLLDLINIFVTWTQQSQD